MALTIRRPIEIELPRRQDAEEKERARLAEEQGKFRDKVLERARKNKQPEDAFRRRVMERAEKIRTEREAQQPPEPEPEEDGGGLLGRLKGIGEGALDVGRAVAEPLVEGFQETEPARRFIGRQLGQIVGSPATLAHGLGVPGAPSVEQAGRAGELVATDPLEAARREVEFGRPITEPLGRAVGRGVVAAVPEIQAADVITGGKLSDLLADIGGVVGPELLVLSNFIPFEAPLFAGAKVLFKGRLVPKLALEALARVARGGATRETTEAVVRTNLTRFADDAAQALSLGDIPPRTEAGRPFAERFDVPTEAITPETAIPPGVSRAAPLEGQQIADLPAGQVELPFPRTRNAQEIAQLAGERRNNLRALQEGAEAGTNTADEVLLAEADLMSARQADNAARLADTDDLTKRSFNELIEDARKACRG